VTLRLFVRSLVDSHIWAAIDVPVAYLSGSLLVNLSVSLPVTWLCFAKTAERIKVMFRVKTSGEPKEHCVGWGVPIVLWGGVSEWREFGPLLQKG